MSDWKVAGTTEMPKGNNPMGNKFYGYRKTALVLPDGRPATYHGLMVGDCVHTLAIENDLTTYLVKQKRPNLLRSGDSEVPTTWELPGGFAEPDISNAESAKRELRSEIGRVANNIVQIGTLYTSPGVSDERDHIFLATDLVESNDLGEVIEATEQDLDVIRLPFREAYERLRRGDIPVAAQTLAAFSIAAARL